MFVGIWDFLLVHVYSPVRILEDHRSGSVVIVLINEMVNERCALDRAVKVLEY